MTPSYRPDGVLTDGHYGVITTIDGKTITDGNVYDNYRYHYDGDVTLSMPNKPDFEPSAQVLPEPNQPATQYRELTTELTTDKGMGEFTLKYNGSRFTILPDDDAAMKLIVVGDETKNRALFEKALHVAFTQMGLEVADLDGVYIHFGKD